ncbi:MAG: right-handed parallel beta-helix repeat-containing protein [Gaiellaceae bacterium]
MTLTVEPGVVVKLNASTRTIFVNGVLHAVGTGASPIIFTSLQDDSVAGDSGGDGATSGSPGQWHGIRITGAGSQLSSVKVRYGGWGSSDTAYAAIQVSGTQADATISDSLVSDNQRSGVLVSSGGHALIEGSTIEQNKVGVAVTGAAVDIQARTNIRANITDGVTFSLASTYAGPASSITDSDVRENGEDGVDIFVDRTLAVAKWPHGNWNNIFFNTGKQLRLSGYHPSGYIKQYQVDWSGNFWGPDVYYWTGPAACLTSSPNSPGHLAYHSSNPPPGPGGLTPPPDGPLTWNTYLAGSGNDVVYCAYDRFKDLGECSYSSAYIESRTQVILFEQPKEIDEALSCTPAGAHITRIEADSPSTCPDIRLGYLPDPNDTLLDIIDDFQAFIEGLANEITDFGDYVCEHAAAKAKEVVAQVGGGLETEVTLFTNPELYACMTTPWTPTEGTIRTGVSFNYPSQRSIYQTFGWDEGHLLYLKTCGSEATFEPDSVFDNYDGYHYFGAQLGYGTNLPRGYIDSNAFDEASEPVYTVGTADVQALGSLPAYRYFTLVRTAAGNASTDRGKLLAQLGGRFPAACYNPSSCIFAVDTEFLIGSSVDPWQLTVPGFTSWGG